jgi:hypothetical protein
MATIESYIADIEARIAKNRQYIETTLDDAKRVGRSTLTKSADTEVERRFGLIDADKKALERARAIKSDEDSLESRLSETRSTGAYDNHERKTATVSVSRNERTYHQGKDIEAGFKNQPGGAFLLDIARSHLGDPMATDRLTRHMREEYVEKPWLQERSSDTTNFTGLVVPQYLTDQAAPAVSAMRPLADVMSPRSLPDTGMSVNLARITTPTAAGIQTSQNTTVTTQDIDDTLLTLNVQTAAGYSQLSRQAVERGILTEDVTTTDLLKRVAAALDVQLLGQASVGLAATATSQTYTNATVDTTAIPAFMKQLIQAQNAVETNMLAQASPSHFIMHPRRFNWCTAAVSSTWPVFSGTNVPPQSWGMMLTNEYGPSVRAVLPNGMKVTVDANVTTTGLATALTGGTQDHVYCITAAESYLYEPPQRTVMIRAEQPAATSLGILFVAYEYFAATFQRYTGQSVVVNGTGLATPSFA